MAELKSARPPREAGRVFVPDAAGLFSLGGGLFGRSLLRLGLFLGGRVLSYGLILLGSRLLGGSFLGGCFDRGLCHRGVFVGRLLLRSSLLRLGLFAMIMVIMAAIRAMDVRLQVAIFGLNRSFQLFAAD